MAYNLYKVHATTDKDSPIIFEGIRKEVCHELDIDEINTDIKKRKENREKRRIQRQRRREMKNNK